MSYSRYRYSDNIDYDHCDWEESNRTQEIQDVWYTENGDTFKFGKYVDININTHCIGYDEDDEWNEINQTHEGYLGNAGATQSTTYSKYIAVLFSQDHQFEIFLNGKKGIKAGVEWIEYLVDKDRNRDITSEINAIINKFDGNKHTLHIIKILIILKQHKMWALMSKFINEKLVSNGVGLHTTTQRTKSNEHHGLRDIIDNTNIIHPELKIMINKPTNQ